MKLDFPRYSERIGPVAIHAIQRIYELDSGRSRGFHDSHQTIKKFDYDELSCVMHDMAIVIPIKNEKLKLLEGVLSGIPNDVLVIIVSNSRRRAVDRYSVEVESVRQLSRFMDKKIVMIHQSDPALSRLFSRVGYHSILDYKGNVRAGKAEGMVIGILLAKMFQKDYVGFIDADNFIPGAVNEYVKIFAAGFGMSSSPYSCVRVSWVYKPKVKDSTLHFAKWGRVSEISNSYVNALLSHLTGFETEIVRTANAGEHALSMPLAEKLHFSSGYSVETHELMDILERFGGLIDSASDETSDYSAARKGVEIFQIETRNPHLHEEKGAAHLVEMLEASLAIIYRSPLCPASLKQDILDYLKERMHSKEIAQADRISSQLKSWNGSTMEVGDTDQIISGSGSQTVEETPARQKNKDSDGLGDLAICTSYPVISPVSNVPISDFEKSVRAEAKSFCRFGGVK